MKTEPIPQWHLLSMPQVAVCIKERRRRAGDRPWKMEQHRLCRVPSSNAINAVLLLNLQKGKIYRIKPGGGSPSRLATKDERGAWGGWGKIQKNKNKNIRRGERNMIRQLYMSTCRSISWYHSSFETEFSIIAPAQHSFQRSFEMRSIEA